MVNKKNVHSSILRFFLKINVAMLIVWFEIVFIEDG